MGPLQVTSLSANATMNDWLHWRALATPEKLAVLYDGRSVSYAELDQLAGKQVAGLVQCGIQAGDRVAALSGNSVEAIALIHAAARARAVLVPLNTRLSDVELGRQIALVEPKLLLVDDQREFGDVGAVAESQPALANVTPPLHESLETVLLGDLGCGASLKDIDSPVAPAASASSASHPQAIIFTSGTTGLPNGVALSQDNHFWSATASAYRLGLDTDDRWLSCLPLYHVGGLAVVFRSCLYGTAIVLHRAFDLDEFQRSLHSDAVTLTSLVPTMLHRLLNSAGATAWPDSLRMVLLGGAAADRDLLDAASEAGLPVATTYGLTETASQVATAPPREAHRKPGSVGRPLMFTEVRIADAEGRALGREESGEILVRGPQVMTCYYGNPRATGSALREGWLHTGDVGYIDAEGDLFVLQRRTDMIVSGGENIHPAEVETVLRGHPDVVDACVVGLPDAEWGQRCAAAIQVRPGRPLDRASLLAYSRPRLAAYKQPAPEHIRFVEELPKTGSGKIARGAVETLLTSNGSELQETQR